MYDQNSLWDDYQCVENCECSMCWESEVVSDMEKILDVCDYLDVSGDLY